MARFLTLLEVAEVLCMKRRAVYDLVYRGQLRAMKVGAIWRVSVEDLQAFRDSKEAPPPA